LPRVIVAGRIDIDAVIRVSRHPRPGEEIGGRNLEYLPGGKGANQAVAAARTGAEVTIFGCVGSDVFGTEMIDFLRNEKIDTKYISRLPGRRTGMAFVVVDDRGQNTIVYDAGDMPPLAFDTAEAIRAGDVLVSQFDIPYVAIMNFLSAGRKQGACNIFNAAPAQPVSQELLGLIDILILNEFELAYALDQGPLNPEDRAQIEVAIRAFNRPPKQALVVTLGEFGAAIKDGERVLWIEASNVTPVDTTGAGDAFTGAIAAELAAQVPLEQAARYACAAASVSVTRHGAGVAMPQKSEVQRQQTEAILNVELAWSSAKQLLRRAMINFCNTSHSKEA
jgi:ribokinase